MMHATVSVEEVVTLHLRHRNAVLLHITAERFVGNRAVVLQKLMDLGRVLRIDVRILSQVDWRLRLDVVEHVVAQIIGNVPALNARVFANLLSDIRGINPALTVSCRQHRLHLSPCVSSQVKRVIEHLGCHTLHRLGCCTHHTWIQHRLKSTPDRAGASHSGQCVHPWGQRIKRCRDRHSQVRERHVQSERIAQPLRFQCVQCRIVLGCEVREQVGVLGCPIGVRQKHIERALGPCLTHTSAHDIGKLTYGRLAQRLQTTTCLGRSTKPERHVRGRVKQHLGTQTSSTTSQPLGRVPRQISRRVTHDPVLLQHVTPSRPACRRERTDKRGKCVLADQLVSDHRTGHVEQGTDCPNRMGTHLPQLSQSRLLLLRRQVRIWRLRTDTVLSKFSCKRIWHPT